MAGQGCHKTTKLFKKGRLESAAFFIAISPDYMQMIMAVPVCAGSVNAVLVKGFSC
jgi:hypothetical protein